MFLVLVFDVSKQTSPILYPFIGRYDSGLGRYELVCTSGSEASLTNWVGTCTD